MPTTVRRALIVAGVAAGAATALWAIFRTPTYFDLRIYVAAMRWWADGGELYDWYQPDRLQGRLHFTYPPFAALLLRPTAALPLGVTITLITAGTVAATALTTWWLIRPLARRYGWPWWYAVGFATPLILMVEPVWHTITFGQINMWLVVLILGDLLLLRGRRWAGVGVGLATAIKLIPGIFIVYLLVARRWRAAATASAVAAGVTLLAAALMPRASWQYWTVALWATERVGRTDYTGNQSVLGVLSRLVTPAEPDRVIWLVLIVVIAAFGLWRAARAARVGDDVAGLTLAGLVGALVSPITWQHHLYWFVPAVFVLLLAATNGYRPRAVLVVAALAYGAALFGVVSFVSWGFAYVPTTTVPDFILRNLFVLVSLMLLVTLPVGRCRTPFPSDTPADAPADAPALTPPPATPPTIDLGAASSPERR